MGDLNKYEIGLLGGSFQAKELKIWRNKEHENYSWEDCENKIYDLSKTNSN